MLDVPRPLLEDGRSAPPSHPTLRSATAPHPLSQPCRDPVIRRGTDSIMAATGVSCSGKALAVRSRAIAASIERRPMMPVPASQRDGRPAHLRQRGRPVAGRRLASRASAWRVAIEVQHPRGLVAFAAPRRPARRGRWRQLGRGERAESRAHCQRAGCWRTRRRSAARDRASGTGMPSMSCLRAICALHDRATSAMVTSLRHAPSASRNRPLCWRPLVGHPWQLPS